VQKMGKGDKIIFWEDTWLDGDTTLLAKYPRLYLISCQQNQTIQEMGAQEGNGWEWKFNWRRHLFDSELQMADCFLKDVNGAIIQPHRRDTWIWKPDPSGQFSVRSVYHVLKGEELEGDDAKVFEEIWKLRIPPKFAIFAWRLLKKRLPSKENLRRRHMEIINASYPFCRNFDENEAHLFFLCDKILPLWWESMLWVSIQGAFPLNPTHHFSQHMNCLAKGIRDTRWRCWWLALTWAVWQ